jgi:hypothetical protein
MGYNVDEAADEMKRAAEEKAKISENADKDLQDQIARNKIVETNAATK